MAGESRPHVAMKPGGMGVSAQRTNMAKSYPLAQYEGNVNVPDKRPLVMHDTGGADISAQRKVLGTGLAAPFPY